MEKNIYIFIQRYIFVGANIIISYDDATSSVHPWYSTNKQDWLLSEYVIGVEG